jgi:hypothetical protein
LLIGEAGNGKSVALRKAKRILNELGDVPISRSVETPEGLWRFMNGDPKADPPIESPVAFIARWPDGELRECHPMTIVANEFVNFISKDPEGWTNSLNDIYDEDKYEYRTKNKGEDNLTGPYIVILGALTTEVSFDLQKSRIISTGLARRTIFQYGERKWHDPHSIPSYDEEKKAQRQATVDHAKKLRKVAGEFKWSIETRAWWDVWYRGHMASIPESAPHLKSWLTSKSTQVLKISMLTSLSESHDLELKVKHLETAIAYLDIMEADLYKVFGGIGRNELAAIAVKIEDYLERQPRPVELKKLGRTFWPDCKPPYDFEACLQYLIDTGQATKCVFTEGNNIKTLVAVPTVMAAFATSLRPPPSAAAPPSSNSDAPAATDPSTPPEPNPSSSEEPPNVARFPTQIGFVPPPSVG